MAKNRKHGSEFRFQIIKDNSIRSLSKKWNITTSLIRKWIDHPASYGVKGLLPKCYSYYTREFKLNVVKAYRDKRLSLRYR